MSCRTYKKGGVCPLIFNSVRTSRTLVRLKFPVSETLAQVSCLTTWLFIVLMFSWWLVRKHNRPTKALNLTLTNTHQNITTKHDYVYYILYCQCKGSSHLKIPPETIEGKQLKKQTKILNISIYR